VEPSHPTSIPPLPSRGRWHSIPLSSSRGRTELKCGGRCATAAFLPPSRCGAARRQLTSPWPPALAPHPRIEAQAPAPAQSMASAERRARGRRPAPSMPCAICSSRPWSWRIGEEERKGWWCCCCHEPQLLTGRGRRRVVARRGEEREAGRPLAPRRRLAAPSREKAAWIV
jgi:hypothetical protein